MIADIGETWVTFNQREAVSCHRGVGVAIALNGSEDSRLSGEAAKVFRYVGMAAKRDEAVELARDLFAKGAVWPAIVDHILHPSDCGYIEEGHELQEPEDPDQARPDSATDAADLREAQAVGDWDSDEATAEAATGALAPLAQGDDPAQVALAEEQMQRPLVQDDGAGFGRAHASGARVLRACSQESSYGQLLGARRACEGNHNPEARLTSEGVRGGIEVFESSGKVFFDESWPLPSSTCVF